MNNAKPRFLYFDIETSLMQAYTFYIGHKVSISFEQIKVPKKVICISYKWSDESKVRHLVWNPRKEIDGQMSQMLDKFNKIARKADYLVAHNGISFDVREIRSEIAIRNHDTPWCETPVIDTLNDYRRVFRFPSNKLDAVAKSLGLDRKTKMCLQDWIEVSKGNLKALKKMVKYCDQDVKILEAVHKRLDKYVPPQASKLRLKQAKVVNPESSTYVCCKGHSTVKYGRYKYKGSDKQQWLCQGCFKVNR